MNQVKFIPPFTVEVAQEGLPVRTVNPNKLQVQEEIEKGLQDSLKGCGFNNKKMTQKEIMMQIQFIRGASAALQAVFGSSTALTDFVKPTWVTSIWRNERIGGDNG